MVVVIIKRLHKKFVRFQHTFFFNIFGCTQQIEQALLHPLARKFSPCQSYEQA